MVALRGPGKLADLIERDGNPLEDVEVVVKDGEVMAGGR